MPHDDLAYQPPEDVAPPDALLRTQMVVWLERQGRITDPTIAAAMRAVPRHHFLPDAPLDRAYADDAIVTKWDADKTALSSASQPSMIAIMLEQLDVRPGMRILEIGAGTGYNAALLAYLTGPGGHVTTIDIDTDIVTAAREHLVAEGLGPERVTVAQGDGAQGWDTNAPYDRIILTVGAWDVAPAWFVQLTPTGRMVLPLALHTMQVSVALDRADETLRSASLRPCGFIRLRGAFAGPEQQLVVDAASGLRLLADPPLDNPAQLGALLATRPRALAAPGPVGDGLRYLLAFSQPQIVALLAHPAHPHLGGQALGIMTPEGDSACFLAHHGATHQVTQGVEYGAATAGLAMEGVIAHWRALGQPDLYDWQMTLHPTGMNRPTTDDPRTFWLPKDHWQIALHVAHRA